MIRTLIAAALIAASAAAHAGQLGTPIPSTATGVYVADGWACAHEFGMTNQGKRYWRPACIRLADAEPYAAHYAVWQYPEDCPVAGLQNFVPLFLYGQDSPRWRMELVSYSPGRLTVSLEPLVGDGPGQTLAMEIVHVYAPPVPYAGCAGRASKHHWLPEG